MAEELPEGAAEPNAPADDDGVAAPPDKRRLSVTWLILIPLLLVAVGMLASDIFRGRLPQKAAFEKVNERLTHDSSDDLDDSGGGFGGRRGGSQSKPLTAEAVHEILGRQPSLSEEKNGNLTGKDNPDVEMEPILVETYKFPGIMKSYEVVVTYAEIPAADGKPATTALTYVRKN